MPPILFSVLIWGFCGALSNCLSKQGQGGNASIQGQCDRLNNYLLKFAGAIAVSLKNKYSQMI
jgi:hypothetical protein